MEYKEQKQTATCPTTQYKSEDYTKQQQSPPGLLSEMKPVPDCGEETYRGSNRLRGRKVLITGGDSGIGRAVAIAYIREGADVCINYLPNEQKDADSLKCLLDKEMKSGGSTSSPTMMSSGGSTSTTGGQQSGIRGTKFEMIPGDLRNESFCKKLVEECKSKLGGLDTLVLVAGRQTAVECITDLSLDQLRDTFEVNVFSLVHIVKAALPHLSSCSNIITTSDIYGFKASPFLLDYSASKSAIVSITQSLAKQLAPKGIRVNCVAPGQIWSNLVVTGGISQDRIPKFGKNTPLGRAGQPAELAGMYVYLASNESSYCTGDVFPITGGKHL